MAELRQSAQVVPLGPGFRDPAGLQPVDREVVGGQDFAGGRIGTHHAELRPPEAVPRRDAVSFSDEVLDGLAGVGEGRVLGSQVPHEVVAAPDRLLACGPLVRDWVGQGASLYVCGSLEGMGAGVEQALLSILGPDLLQSLREDGRYRRDVY